jgi:hypothetical protein
VGIGHIHAVIHDNQISTRTVHMATNTQSLHGRAQRVPLAGRVQTAFDPP